MYIHNTSCISPQGGFTDLDGYMALAGAVTSESNIMLALEPRYENIPNGILRRMGRAVRLGVGSAMPLVTNVELPDGIILGTSMGGMEDCIKFLNQIIEYNEGTLTPTNFVQSTANAIAGQLGLLSKNKGYNITHVHRGFSFENALIDASMMLTENPGATYLVGAVDEISSCNYNIERLEGWYKQKTILSSNLYNEPSAGSIAGEGAAMFIVNNRSQNALAKISGTHIFQTEDAAVVKEELKRFIASTLKGGFPDILLSGENGDQRFQHFYEMAETMVGPEAGIARFKHLVGEYPTATGFACWMASCLLSGENTPVQIFKRSYIAETSSILIYNHYKGIQHSLILLEGTTSAKI